MRLQTMYLPSPVGDAQTRFALIAGLRTRMRAQEPAGRPR